MPRAVNQPYVAHPKPQWQTEQSGDAPAQRSQNRRQPCGCSLFSQRWRLRAVVRSLLFSSQGFHLEAAHDSQHQISSSEALFISLAKAFQT